MNRLFQPALIALVLLAPSAAARAADDRLEEARVHLQKGRVDEALEIYDELARAKADDSQAALGQSRCFEARGSWKEATAIIDAAVKKSPRDVRLLARLGELYLSQGRFDEADRAIAKAHEIDAELPEARLVEADLNAALGRLKEADDGYHWFVKFYNRAQPEDAETLL